jgi:hypothetical protein
VFLSGLILLFGIAQVPNYGEGKGKAILEAGRPAHGCRAKTGDMPQPGIPVLVLLTVRRVRHRRGHQNCAASRLTFHVSFADDSVISVSVLSTPSTALIVSLRNRCVRTVCVVACAAFLTWMRQVTG